MTPIRSAVHVMRPEFVEMLMHGKTMEDFPHHAQAAELMLDDLIWWARTLRAGRHG